MPKVTNREKLLVALMETPFGFYLVNVDLTERSKTQS
jgi:hypothetical protein